MRKTSKKRKATRISFFKNKRTLSLAFGVCLTVLASAYITNARYSADSSVDLPEGSCIKGNDKTLLASYAIKVLDADQNGVSGKKIIVRAPLFTYNSEKKTWNDPLSAKDYVASVGTVYTDKNGDATIKVPYCVIGNKYYLGNNNQIFRSINFYLESVNLPAQNISSFFSAEGYSLAQFRKDVVTNSTTEPIIFSVF